MYIISLGKQCFFHINVGLLEGHMGEELNMWDLLKINISTYGD